jgi:hypothetical protein
MTTKSPRLDPLTAARLKAQARCPDCSSSVSLTQNGHGPGLHRLDIRHYDTCPTLAALRSGGRDRGQLVLAKTPGQSTKDFARAALAAAALMAEETGRQVGIHADAYGQQPLAVTTRTAPRGSRGSGRGKGTR